jgi:hypothetical protein
VLRGRRLLLRFQRDQPTNLALAYLRDDLVGTRADTMPSMISAAMSESKFEAEVRKAIKIAIAAIQHTPR